MTALSLRSFRCNCKDAELPAVEDLLAAQEFSLQADPFYPKARRLLSGPFSLGASAAARFGYIYIQDRASMLPPLALAPEAGAVVLDMCAAPGGKTSLAADLAGPTGFVLGCEPNASRLATLRRNLSLLNLPQCATLGAPAESLPLPSGEASGLGRILLDPPCSGWGTVEKNPQVLRLWKGDKVKPLVSLQRKLLREAARLLAPGGRLVYSTCTTNVEENEAQLLFARDDLGLSFCPLSAPPGFSFRPAALPEFAGVLRTAPGPDAQGFFVALLEKPWAAPACRPAETRSRPGKRPAVWQAVARASLESPCADPALLPPGELRAYGEVVHFLPEHFPALLPEGTAWKGFPLGKIGPDGRIRLSPGLRFLMPPVDEAQKRGAIVLNLEETAPLEALLRGESLPVAPTVREAGLYFRGLPLCRLAIKGRRALLPALF